MRNKKSLGILVASIIVLGLARIGTSKYGMNLTGPNDFWNNAPYTKQCNSCHGGQGTKALPEAQFKLGGQSSSNWTYNYAPDSVYTIDLSTKNLSARNAFTVSVIDSMGEKVGSYIYDGYYKTRGAQLLDSSTNKSVSREILGNGAGWTFKNWTFEWKAPNKDRGPLKMYVSMVAGDNSNTVTGDTVYTQIVNLLPDTIAQGFKIVREGGYDRCINDSVTFRVTKPVGVTKYNWTATRSHKSSSIDSVFKVKLTSTGLAVVTLSGMNGGRQAFNYRDSVMVSSPKTATINVSVNKNKICPGDTATLTANTTNTKFLWSTGDTTKSIKVTEAGVYTLWSSNASCTTNPVSVTMVKGDTAVEFVVPAPDSACINSIIQIRITPGHTGYIYTLNGSSRSSGSIYNLAPSLLKPAKYNYFSAWAYNSDCMKDPKTIYDSIFIKGFIGTPVQRSLKVEFDSVIWEWDSVQYATGYEVSKDGGATWQVANGTYKHTFRGLSHGTSYDLLVRGISPLPQKHWCVDPPKSAKVKTKGCGPFNYSKIMTGSPFCAGGKVDIDFGDFGTNQYEIVLKGEASKGLHYEFRPTRDTTVRFEIRDLASTNCAPYEEVFQLVKQVLPAVTISRVGTEHCSGDKVILNGPAGYAQYRWMYKGAQIGNAQQLQYLFVDASNKVELYVQHSSGCKTDSAVETFNTKPRPTANYSYTSLSADSLEMRFEQTINPNYACIWNLGDGTTKTGNVVTHTYKKKDVYKVRLIVASTNGCQDTMTKDINLGVKVGVATLQPAGGKVVLYPNPADGQVQFELERTGQATVRVLGLSGQVVLQKLLMIQAGKTEAVDLSAMPAGLYMVEIQLGAERWIGKVMKR